MDHFDERIARAATSWTPAFLGRKEVPPNVAKACRFAMMKSRSGRLFPSDHISEGADLVGLSVDEINEALQRLEV
jgi:hypothetical protein